MLPTTQIVFICLVIISYLSTNGIDGFSIRSLSLHTKVNPIQRYNFKSSAAKKDDKAVEVATEYWQGEWVCADCGYVYDRDIDGDGLYFEQQKKGFICPQCSAPRRRYAKKVGDKWGVTNDGGDLPIYAVTFLGLALTTWFALVYVPTL